MLNSQYLKRDARPVCLGVTLDSTMSYKDAPHRKAAKKVKSRNSLLAKLANSSCCADANTLPYLLSSRVGLLLPNLETFVAY